MSNSSNNNPPAQTPPVYRFLPYIRFGIANYLDYSTVDGTDARGKASAKITPKLSITTYNETDSGLVAQSNQPVIQEGDSKTFYFAGAGDVVGLDSKAIVRTLPKSGEVSFNPNRIAAVELYEADLPWRFSLAGPSANNVTLTPWLFLLVLEEGEFTPNAASSTSLPSITINADANLDQLFPLAQDKDLWAHIQVNPIYDRSTGHQPAIPDSAALWTAMALQQGANGPSATDQDKYFARIISPRKLDARKSYKAFLVPHFELGRRRALQLDMKDEDFNSLAADPNIGSKVFYESSTVDTALQIPYFYSYSFKTGDADDFELYARRIGRADSNKVISGIEVDYSQAGFGVDHGQGKTIIDGILAPQRYEFDENDPDHPRLIEEPPFADTLFEDSILELINQGTSLEMGTSSPDSGEYDPKVLPPIYGSHYDGTFQLDPSWKTESPTPWIYELNTDPRLRLAAGAGAAIIRKYQDQFVATAFKQLEDHSLVQAGINQLVFNAMAQRSHHERLVAFRDPAQNADQLMRLATMSASSIRSQDGGTLKSQAAKSVLGADVFSPHAARRFSPVSTLARRQEGSKYASTTHVQALNATPSRPYLTYEQPKNALEYDMLGRLAHEVQVFGQSGDLKLADQIWYAPLLNRSKGIGNRYVFGVPGMIALLDLDLQLGLTPEQRYSAINNHLNNEGVTVSLFNAIANDFLAASGVDEQALSALVESVTQASVVTSADFDILVQILVQASILPTSGNEGSPLQMYPFSGAGLEALLDLALSLNLVSQGQYESIRSEIQEGSIKYWTFSAVAVLFKVLNDLDKPIDQLVGITNAAENVTQTNFDELLNLLVGASIIENTGSPQPQQGLGGWMLDFSKSVSPQNYASDPSPAVDSGPMDLLKAAVDIHASFEKKTDATHLVNIRFPMQNGSDIPSDARSVGGATGGAHSVTPIDPLRPVAPYPSFDYPMAEYLRKEFPELFSLQVKDIPNDSVVVLGINHKIVEAYMVGLHHEFSRELYWRGFPTDQRGSYFRKFWNDRDSGKDTTNFKFNIKPLTDWGHDSWLGSHFLYPDPLISPDVKEPESYTNMLIKAELLKKYPNTVIYLRQIAPNEDGPDQCLPVRRSKLTDDITQITFDVPIEKVTPAPDETDNGSGYYLVFEERIGEPVLGLAPADSTNPITPPVPIDNLTWDILPANVNQLNSNDLLATDIGDPGNKPKNSASVARMLFRKPFQVNIPANLLVLRPSLNPLRP